jgi:hypothetical protein
LDTSASARSVDVSSVISSDGTAVAFDRSGACGTSFVEADRPSDLAVTLPHTERQALAEQPREVAQDVLAPALPGFFIGPGQSTS